MNDEPLVSTGVAARALGVSSSSIARWAKAGRITPALITPGGPHGPGQYRWNVEDLRRQLLEMARQSGERGPS